MKKMDELYSKRWQQTLLVWKFEQKKQDPETLYVDFPQKQFDTWNVQITLQSHTSYFLIMKYIQAL